MREPPLGLSFYPGPNFAFSNPANFQPHSYTEVVSLSFPIAQHICTIFIFLATFVRIKTQILDPRLLVWASIFAFALGYLAWQAIEVRLAKQFRQVRKPTNRMFYRPSSSSTGILRSAVSVDAKTFKSSILAFLALLSLSPVMKTLTASTSSDSIWALTACLFVLNALIADYSSPRPEIYTRERCGCRHCLIFGTRGPDSAVFFFFDCWSCSLTSVLSINAAISASVVLASRLPDDISVFALMLYAVVLFAMFPVLRHRLQVSVSLPSLSSFRVSQHHIEPTAHYVHIPTLERVHSRRSR